jgi:hypothetical protein
MMNIEKNVPIRERRAAVAIPYDVMEVGDSIFVTGASLQNVCNRNWRWGKKLGRAYVARKEGDGIRVWRTT